MRVSLVAFFSLFSVLSFSSQSLVIEDFESLPNINLKSDSNVMSGPAPEQWEKPNVLNELKDYVVVFDGTSRFLRAKFLSGTKGKVIFKKAEWNVVEKPFLSWSWRALDWATGSTVKDNRKEDSTASVYVSFKSGMKNYVIKYIWAHTDSVGTGYSKGKWNPAGALEAIVVRTGGELNQWVQEKRNVVEDFKSLYKRDIPSPMATGIGVLTEGDGTQTQPQADYDNFVASSN